MPFIDDRGELLIEEIQSITFLQFASSLWLHMRCTKGVILRSRFRLNLHPDDGAEDSPIHDFEDLWIFVKPTHYGKGTK